MMKQNTRLPGILACGLLLVAIFITGCTTIHVPGNQGTVTIDASKHVDVKTDVDAKVPLI